MKIQTSVVASYLSFAGSIIILINILALAINGTSIVILSSQPTISLTNNTLSLSGSWYRIAFGIKPFVEGLWILFWLFIAILNLALAASMVLTPERPKENITVLILSIILLLTGGGFMIGTILVLIGTIMSFQWRRTIGETFIGRILRVLKLDSKLFRRVKQNEDLLNESAFIVILVGFLSGLGSSIYLYNADRILHSSIEDIIRILLFGEVYFDLSTFSLPIMNVALSITKWFILSLIIYIVGSKITGIENVKLSDVLRVLGYAYVPIALQVFFPIVFSTEPILSTSWPLTVILLTNLWMILALIIAIKECYTITLTKSLGILTLSGPVYWILVNKFILPITFRSSIPGILFNIEPMELILMLTSLSFILSYIFGVFKKY